MTVENFKPTLWAGRLLKNLNNAHVFANCVNRDYEGEIKSFGDTVKISNIGRITVKSYTSNSDIDTPERIDGATQELRIDQGDYFNFAIDDVDDAQTKPKLMDPAMKESAWAMSDEVDLYLANETYGAVASANQLTPADVGLGASDSNIYEILVDLARVLDESNTPSEDRWAVITPKMLAELRKDPRFSSFGTEVNRRVIRGNSLGELAEFDIKVSNNAPREGQTAWGSSGFNIGLSSGEEVLLAGYKGAITYAEQVVKTEAFRPERRFEDAVKGLQVYGSKITRPDNIARATFGYA